MPNPIPDNENMSGGEGAANVPKTTAPKVVIPKAPSTQIVKSYFIDPNGEFVSLPFASEKSAQEQGYVSVDKFLDKDEETGGIKLLAPDGTKAVYDLKDVPKLIAQGYKPRSQVEKEAKIAKLVEDRQNTSGGLLGISPEDYDVKRSIEVEASKERARVLGHVYDEAESAKSQNAEGLTPESFDAIAKEQLERVEKNKNNTRMNWWGDVVVPGSDAKTIEVINPKTSRVETIQKSKLTEYAVRNPGFRFNNEEQQLSYDAEVAYNKLHSKETQAMAGLTSFEKGATSGVFDVSRGNELLGRNTDQRAIATAAQQVSEDEYKKTQLAGGLDGIGTSLATTGGAGLFGEGLLGAKLAAQVPGSAGLVKTVVQGAVQGAAYTAPEAAAQLVLDKNPQAAAETLMFGAGIGSLFGAGSKAFSKGIEAVQYGTSQVGNVAGQRAAEQFGLSSGERPIRQDMVKLILGDAAEGGRMTIPTAERAAQNVTSVANGERLEPLLAKLDQLAAKEGLPGIKAQELIDELNHVSIGRQEARTLLETSAIDGQIPLASMPKLLGQVGAEVKPLFRQAMADKASSLAPELNNLGKLEADTTAKILNGLEGSKAAAGIEQLLQAAKTSTEKKDVISNVASWLAKGVGNSATAAAGGLLPIPGGALIMNKIASDSVENFAKPFIENIIRNNQTKIPSALLKFANSPAAGSYIILDQLANQASKLNAIPELLKTKQAAIKAIDPIRQFLGPDQSRGLSDKQAFNKVSGQVAQMAGNPQMRDAHLKDLLSPFLSHPIVVDTAKQNAITKINYIDGIIPKNTSAPKPFSKETEWQPSPTQMKDFKQQLAVINDPFALLDAFAKGKVTAKQVMAVSATSPEILNQMRAKIAETAYSGKVELNYQQKLNASTIMGQPMTKSADKQNVGLLQQVYGPTGKPVEQQGKQTKSKKAKLNTDKMLAAQPTPFQSQLK